MGGADRDDARKNWFDEGGQGYAKFRPDYPPELAGELAGLCSHHRLAIDVGCGTGQLTTLLAPHFEAVIGLDPSADQIANARPADRVDYRVSPAERLPLPDGGVDLVTVAQAVHWFELPAFYAEVRRVAAPDAVLALVSYGVAGLEPGLDERFRHFYWNEVGPYWPPERGLVDSGYATLDFPFEELAPPRLEIRKAWNLPQFLGYSATWSAVRRAREAGQAQLLQRFAEDLAGLWGDANASREIVWPVNMRLGRIPRR